MSKYTEVSFPVGSLRFKMSSSHWIKTQIFTKLMKSDGHLSMLTFWFSWCSCQMELTTSFQSKLAKFETFLHFFSIRSAADAAAVRKGEERGEKDKLCSGTVGKWQFFTWPRSTYPGVLWARNRASARPIWVSAVYCAVLTSRYCNFVVAWWKALKLGLNIAN